MPGLVLRWIARGRELHQEMHLGDAAAHYARAHALDPDNPVPVQLLGVIAFQEGRHAEALDSFDSALALKPDYVDAHNNRGTVLAELKRFEDALISFDKAIAIAPDNAYAHNNRGNVLHALKRHDEALASYDRAIALNLSYKDAYKNRGISLGELGRFDEALASYSQACSIDPNQPEVIWNKSLIYLRRGEFLIGWRLYEWGWPAKQRGEQPRHGTIPLWLGDQELSGKTILLWSEQGLGDTIQFCRLARLVAARGARVVLEVPHILLPVLKGLEGADSIVAIGNDLPTFDYQCPLLSLPLALRLSLLDVSGKPYLQRADARQWIEKLQIGTPAIGVAWSGNIRHQNDANRSIPFSSFRQCLPAGISYISLLKDIREEDQIELAHHSDVMDISPHLHDFGDTAALIQSLDLIITVDTSIAHLAGAMGKETWILLPFIADWRWLLNRSDSPWYDSVTLFRQPKIGDWDTVLREIRRRLEPAAS